MRESAGELPVWVYKGSPALPGWFHVPRLVSQVRLTDWLITHICVHPMFPDEDECRGDPLICGEAGRCENAVGSFNCRCEDGFSVRPELGPECVDENECLMGNFDCPPNAECVNTEVNELTTIALRHKTKQDLHRVLFSLILLCESKLIDVQTN